MTKSWTSSPALKIGEAHGLAGHEHDRCGVEAVVAHDDDHVAGRVGRAGLADLDVGRRLAGALHADEHERDGDDAEDDDDDDRGA